MSVSELDGFFVTKFFKVSMRTNLRTNLYSGYYRLVESYPNYNDKVCHCTLLNAGYLDELKADQLNLIQKILTEKVAHPAQSILQFPSTDDAKVIHYDDEFYNLMVDGKRTDVLMEKQERKTPKSGKDFGTIDFNSIRHSDVRKVGAEWMSYQAMSRYK